MQLYLLQSYILRRRLLQQRHGAAAKQRGCLAAVEANATQIAALLEQFGEIIQRQILLTYAAVQTAIALTLLDNIPQGYTSPVQSLQSFGISQIRSGTAQAAHDRPERIARVGIILRCLQRSHSGHAAQYQHTRIRAIDRSKALHDWLRINCHPGMIEGPTLHCQLL